VKEWELALKQDQIINISLVILTVLSYLIIRRQDLLVIIDDLLQKEMVNLLKLSKFRVFMLCGYMLDTVFQTLSDPSQALDFLLSELLSSLTQRKNKKDLAAAY